MLIRVACLLLLSPALAYSQPSVDWLAPLIGEWRTVDTFHPAKGAPIVESAKRTCRRVLHDAYVECESVVSRPDGTGRSYRFLINYNRNTSRFELLTIWSNVPQKAIQMLTPNAARDRWIVEDVTVIGDDGRSNRHWSEMVIHSPDRIVWTGRRVTGGIDPKDAPIAFQETWDRLRNP